MSLCFIHDTALAFACLLELGAAVWVLQQVICEGGGEGKKWGPLVLNGSACLLFLWKWTTAPTWHLLAHWRTLLLALVSAASSAVFAFPDEPGIQGLRVVASVVLLILSPLSLLLLWLLPTPRSTFSSLEHGPHRVGTTSFNLHGDLLLPSDPLVAVQVWFPVSSSRSRERGCCWGTRSVLWTSGNPPTQTSEAEELLGFVAKNGSLPTLVLRHLGTPIIARFSSRVG